MWFRDSIGYHILVDRFAGYDASRDWNKEQFLGGNLRGIADKLPYLADLGINTIWLSPVYKTTAYHGYNIIDFYSTDERFGTEEDLKDLIRRAHEINMRIILDFVPNHCSREHPIFEKAFRDKKSPYRRWFYFSRFSNEYLCFLHFADLPKINLEHAEARNHVIDAAKHWISIGINGFRLDHSIGPSHHFWKIFAREVKSVDPEAALIGEAWLESVEFTMLKTLRVRNKYLRWLYNWNPWDIELEYRELDGSLDFLFRHVITGQIAWKDKPENHMDNVRNTMYRHFRKSPPNYFLPTFIENHDMNRFLFDAGQDRNKLKLALELQFSLAQPPILYYGTETGLSNDKPVSHKVHLSDLQARKPMPWNELDHDLIDYCRELIRKRSLR